jgi:hypothetical protein
MDELIERPTASFQASLMGKTPTAKFKHRLTKIPASMWLPEHQVRPVN